MRNALILSSVLGLVACAPPGIGGGGAYDPDAKETLGRILERRDSGVTTRQSGGDGMTLVIPAGAIWIPIVLERFQSLDLPVFEHKIALEDNRTLSVFSTYPSHPVGGCVKIFESPRRDYPRLINYGGCK